MSKDDTDVNDSDGKPWHNENTLRELYHGEGLTIKEVASELGCNRGSIRYWMKKHDIEFRSRGYKKEWDGAPWRDEDRLRELYHDKEMSTHEIGEEFDCDRTTVLRWMRIHGIERRDRKKAHRMAKFNRWARYRTTQQGYEEWRSPDKDIKGERSVRVHRLVAVAEHGLEALKGKVVHHKNGVSWDNRPENLELLTPSEHSKLHYEQGDSLKPINQSREQGGVADD